MARFRLSNLAALIPDQVITPAQLKGLGMASAGGAAGFMANSLLLDTLVGLPLVDKLGKASRPVMQSLLGLAGGRLAWRWNDDFAKGLAGGLVGHAVASAVMDMVFSRPLALAAIEDEVLGAVPGSPGDEELASLPDPSVSDESLETEVDVEPSELAEIEPSQELRGMNLGVQVESEQSLGSWLS